MPRIARRCRDDASFSSVGAAAAKRRLKKRTETLYWCEKVLRNRSEGQIKALQVRLNLTCWKCFASERATGKANSTSVFCQYGSLKLAHQTCRMSQGRRNNIITSVHAEMTTWGQMRLACVRSSREEKKFKGLQTRVWIVLHNQFLTFQLRV